LLDHAEGENRILPFAFFNTVKPPLTNNELLEKYFRYLADASITQAYWFLKKQPDYEQHSLFCILVHEALTQQSGEQRAERGRQLVQLPFSSEEEDWFEEYLLVKEGKSIHGAKDAVMVRKISMGKFQEALDIGKHLKGRSFDNASWDLIKDAIKEGLGPRGDENLIQFL
jgi:hypothetical protein